MANKKGNKGLAKGVSEEAALRRPKSLDMRIGGLSYRDIGRQLGVSYETARIDVKTILKETLDEAKEEAEELRQIEVERLDILWNKWFARAIGSKELKIMPDKDAALRCLQIMKRRAELLGLDMPQKHEVALTMKSFDEIVQERRSERGLEIKGNGKLQIERGKDEDGK